MTTLQPLHGAGNDLALDLKEWLGLALIEGYVALLVIIHMKLCSRTQKGLEVMDCRQASPTKYWLDAHLLLIHKNRNALRSEADKQPNLHRVQPAGHTTNNA